VKAKLPEGWDEVFSGACLEADVVNAVLEGHGLQTVMREVGPEGDLWPAPVVDQCRIYVPSGQVEQARQVLAAARHTDA
jgi:hypothetical protein